MHESAPSVCMRDGTGKQFFNDCCWHFVGTGFKLAGEKSLDSCDLAIQTTHCCSVLHLFSSSLLQVSR